MTAVLETTPVLIGHGQFTYRGPAIDAPSPLGLLMRATEAAARDAGLAPGALAGLDGFGVVAFAVDAEGALAELPVPRLSNPPASLARELGAALALVSLHPDRRQQLPAPSTPSASVSRAARPTLPWRLARSSWAR